MMLEHASCSTIRNGGVAHDQALVAEKQRNRVRSSIHQVISNQLKFALFIVKVKAAAMHYANVISLLHSSAAEVGNIGHGRNQMNAMIKAFQVFLNRKIRSTLLGPLKSTGLPPHFGTTSDKSTPINVTNHAIMILVMVNGKKTAIPIDAPPVYQFTDNRVEGGAAKDLAEQVVSCLVKINIPPTSFSYLMAHQADGQYQASMFMQTLRELIYVENKDNALPDGYATFFVVPWDTAHWMNCCLEDIREKDKGGEIMRRRLIKRGNKFHKMYAGGRDQLEYSGYAEENNMKALATKVYATTRFASSSFAQFESVYESYEALASIFSAIREPHDDEEETKYQVKGRYFCFDFCGVTDVLSKLMEMMNKAQSLYQFIWSVTKWWPKLKVIVNLMKSKIKEQIPTNDIVLPEQLFPKLSKHFADLTKEEATDCVFKGIFKGF